MTQQQALANLAQLAHAFVDMQIAVLQAAIPQDAQQQNEIPIPEETPSPYVCECDTRNTA